MALAAFPGYFALEHRCFSIHPESAADGEAVVNHPAPVFIDDIAILRDVTCRGQGGILLESDCVSVGCIGDAVCVPAFQRGPFEDDLDFTVIPVLRLYVPGDSLLWRLSKNSQRTPQECVD